VAAEKLVNEWEEKCAAHDRQQRSEHRQKLNAITDALIVGNMQKAVTLMQKLED
jgi:quinol monooxygenase YgiN